MTALFPRTIPFVAHLVDCGEVRVPHSNLATYAIDERGRRWVRKREENTGVNEIMAESVHALLGRRLGARIPDAAVHVDPLEGRSWLSACIPNVAHWEARHRDQVINLPELGAVLALDALIANEDRHRGNLLCQVHGVPLTVRVWAIDAGDALVGYPGDFLAMGLAPPSPRNHARGLPLDLLVTPALAAAQVAMSLDPAELDALVHEACDLAGEADREQVSRALVVRCRHASEILVGYLEAMESLP